MLLVVFAVAVWAQPAIDGIVNGASYARAALDTGGKSIGNNNIAQGAIFVIFGHNMGPATIAAPPGLPLPTSLPDANGTSITISSGGQIVKALMVYTSAGQVAAILPSNTPIGSANVTITYNGQTSAANQINVVKSALGVFTRNSQGSGPAIAQIFRSATDVSLNSLTNSAQSGNTLVIYGTGLGAISVADNDKPGLVPVGSNVTINIAGVTAPAAYAGRSPDFPGLDQINFVLPSNVPAGCYIPAEITASGVPSNLFYLSIGAGSNCAHPLGLGPAALAKLDNGGTVNLGVFELLRAVVSGVPAEGAGGLFDKVNANGAFQIFNRIPNAFGAVNYPVASGSCVVLDTLDTGGGFTIPDFALIGGTELQAGASVNIADANKNSQGILRLDTGGYLGVFFNTLGPGTWTLSGSGGADVGAFSAKTDLPQNLVWTNAGNLSNVPRSDITITWTGGNTNASSLVTIFGTNVVINPADPSKSRGKEFFCNAPASAGRFLVPSNIISQMPSSSADTAAGEVAVGTLGINSGGGSTFSAPLTSGGAIDAGFISYGEAHTISVKYQ